MAWSPRMSEPDSRRSEVIQSVDTLCREFEAAWQADKRPDISDFLDRVEDEQKEPLLARLVLLDVVHRRRFGDTPSAAQYKARFPEYAQVIDAALASEDTQTKSLAVTTPYVATPVELNQSAAQVRTKGPTSKQDCSRSKANYNISSSLLSQEG